MHWLTGLFVSKRMAPYHFAGKVFNQGGIAEQEIAGLEKEAVRFSQLLVHERTEIEKTGKQLDVEQDKINETRKELQPDANLSAIASRLPSVKKEIETLKRGIKNVSGRMVRRFTGNAQTAVRADYSLQTSNNRSAPHQFNTALTSVPDDAVPDWPKMRPFSSPLVNNILFQSLTAVGHPTFF